MQIAREEVEVLKADYDAKITLLQRDKSNLLSELGSMTRKVAEDLYASGRVEEATGVLHKMLNTLGDEICASKGTADWVIGGYRNSNQIGFG